MPDPMLDEGYPVGGNMYPIRLQQVAQLVWGDRQGVAAKLVLTTTTGKDKRKNTKVKINKL